jgi:hypothetical protein
MSARRFAMSERRFAARVKAPYSARLRGHDSEGQAFKEDTLLDNLSVGGLHLHLKRKLVPGAAVSIAVRLSVAPTREIPALRLGARANVLRVEPCADGGYGVAVQFTRRRLF